MARDREVAWRREVDEGESLDKGTMPVAEALDQILVSVERWAILHYHYASTIIGELGEEKGRELVRKAIDGYGREVGERHRQRLIAAGYEPSCENYRVLLDEPRMAWNPTYMPLMRIGGEERPVCPLAKYWMEKGAEDVGKLYCRVDQAKYTAFDPECECRHLKNVLNGDDCCEVVTKKRSEWETVDAARL